MQGAGQRWLIGLAVAAAVTTATTAGAETYTGASGEPVRVIPANPTPPPYRRAVSTPPARRALRRLPPTDSRSYAREIADAAAQYAVPERLIWAVIRVESGFDHRAVSRKGARGLMQLMPATAAILGVRNAFDPRENIHAGTRHLRAMMERFPYDLHLAIAAYNAGEKAVAIFRGVPPYPETRDYVTRVLRLYATPIDCCQSVGSGIQPVGSDIQRIVETDGTVTYTNVAVQRVSVVAVAGVR